MAKIVNVEINNGAYTATYESGKRRTYKKAPKTALAWLEASRPAYTDPFFKDEAAKTIFYLLMMDSESRAKELGISARLFHDPGQAKEWRNRMIKIVHPDNCSHPMAAQATEKVMELFNGMIG